MTDARSQILAAYEAFRRGDVPAVLEIVAEKVDWGVERNNPVVDAVPYLAKVSTRDEVASSYFGGIANTLDFTRFEPLVVAAHGNDVVALVAEAFTHKITGKSLETTAVHHFTVDDDGRIVRFRPFADTHAFIACATP
jgi:uncharacterized protein